ncbi:uncharacterized protein zgc:194981 [Colossoma macropomum]|uniref:uncharacterized protein zgc:194981 n=1 Tax=Colossoma macropomum TaxID=42526 RepID=UPI0018646384|nr:uncharacterized protein zgc:194981 [Colossoma macropomum]XP_036443099.1 uncharacterized protein zgc:194981 [Colossoma macropomum]XP_036443100.1 uncharacterized protein zgc:194981 [Colossoma macropomum]
MTCTLKLFAVVFVSCVVSGSSSAEKTNPSVVKVANIAIDFHNRRSNYIYAYKVVDILSESVQLYPPTWVKYSIKAQVAQTNCINDGKVSLEDCSLRTNAQTMACSFVVLAVPGENTIPSHVLSDSCTLIPLVITETY